MARTSLPAIYLTGGLAPDYSSLARFILRHLDDINDSMLENLVRQISKSIHIDTLDLSGDGTVIQAACSRYKTLTLEASKEQDITPEVENELQTRASIRESKGKDASKTQVCPGELEAVIKKLKRGGSAPGYDACIMTTNNRVIVSTAVAPNSEIDCQNDLLDGVERLGPLGTVRYDSAWFNTQAMDEVLRRDINALIGTRQNQAQNPYNKSKFVYKKETDTYECPEGKMLCLVSKESKSDSSFGCRKYKCNDCLDCPVKTECTSSKTGRIIKRYDVDDSKDAMREVFESPRAKSDYRKRMGMVEPVFGELQLIQGLVRFKRRGVLKVSAELVLHVTGRPT